MFMRREPPSATQRRRSAAADVYQGPILTSSVPLAQQRPEHNRGAIIGTFNLSGAVGILVASVAGGWLFDHWREPGPFVAFGVLAFGMMGAAVLVNRRHHLRKH